MVIELATVTIQHRSAGLRRFVTSLCILLIVLLLLERFGFALEQLVHNGPGRQSFGRLAVQMIHALPEASYLLALWWIRQALNAIAQGELYGPTIQHMLDRVGLMLAVGAFVSVFLVPGLCRVLGYDPGYWIAYDVSALVLGAIGLSLKVIADVLRHAAGVQAELDGIF
ncbi:DUF2975 domain-containing protein [Rhodanobacter sp. L36]|uniref:DUF2975 domain-containing protein n=1 Tax=Rhodanobacter sp. L36 TaxID=1747221 RepID=UPI00131A8B3F|nr:DUF2975 domain-containing protein [Rhodanobacter sp. L36]